MSDASEDCGRPAERAILDEIEARTEPTPDGEQSARGAVWTSTQRMRTQAVKPHTAYEKADLEPVTAALEAQGEIILWHGLAAPATDEYLRAIIQNEQQADYPRWILIGKCNRVLAGGEASGE